MNINLFITIWFDIFSVCSFKQDSGAFCISVFFIFNWANNGLNIKTKNPN